MPNCLHSAIESAPISPGLWHSRLLGIRPVELESCFDDPDRACYCACHDPCGRCCEEMYPRCFFAVVELLADYALTIAVCIEINSPCRYDSNEIWTEALEQRTPSLHSGHGEKDLKCFTNMEEGAPGDGESMDRRNATGGSRCRQLALVEVGLQTGFEDIKGRCYNGRGHAAGTFAIASAQYIRWCTGSMHSRAGHEMRP